MENMNRKYNYQSKTNFWDVCNCHPIMVATVILVGSSVAVGTTVKGVKACAKGISKRREERKAKKKSKVDIVD